MTKLAEHTFVQLVKQPSKLTPLWVEALNMVLCALATVTESYWPLSSSVLVAELVPGWENKPRNFLEAWAFSLLAITEQHANEDIAMCSRLKHVYIISICIGLCNHAQILLYCSCAIISD